MIWHISEFALFGIAIVAFSAAIELGFQVGRKYGAGDGEALHSHISALQNALLGLLALLIGFTFAMSIERFDTRKDLVLEEANAIGTAYLRAHFLPAPYDRKTSQLLKNYVDARIEFYQAGISAEKLQAVNVKAYKIESQLWEQAIAVSKSGNLAIPTSQFVEALNSVIDINEKRQVALENHVPEPVILLLFLVAAVGMGFIGFDYGLKGKRRHFSTLIFALLIAVVLAVILDIDRPRRGLIQVSQASLLRLQEIIGQSELLTAPMPDDQSAALSNQIMAPISSSQQGHP